jgi:methoxymalonate biosynthesis acyl carrier protein
MTDTITEQTMAFIKGRFPQADIGVDEDIFSLGFINSLFAMELVMFIEKAFGFSIPNEDLRIDNFRTVAAMTALVSRHRSGVTVG